MKKNPANCLVLVALFVFCSVAVPCYAKKEPTTALSPIYTADETAKFTSLANETIAALDAGKKEEMVGKLTDLETEWDAQQDKLKPKNSETWTLLDETLDKAISSLRSTKTDLPKGKAALEDLIEKLKQATKQ